MTPSQIQQIGWHVLDVSSPLELKLMVCDVNCFHFHDSPCARHMIQIYQGHLQIQHLWLVGQEPEASGIIGVQLIQTSGHYHVSHETAALPTASTFRSPLCDEHRACRDLKRGWCSSGRLYLLTPRPANVHLQLIIGLYEHANCAVWHRCRILTCEAIAWKVRPNPFKNSVQQSLHWAVIELFWLGLLHSPSLQWTCR